MKRNLAPTRAKLCLIVLMAALSSLGSCGMFGYRIQSPIVKTKDLRIGPGKLTADGVQSEVMSFADTFSGLASQRWNEAAAPKDLEQATPDELYRARHSAHERKLASISAALSIAASPNPMVSLSDMITLMTLERMLLEEPAVAKSFGAQAATNLLATYREQEEAIWRIGARAFTPVQQQELRDLIDLWRSEHPDQRYVSQVRLEDFAIARQQQLPTKVESGSLLSLVMLDPLAGLDPAKREVQASRALGARAFFYMTHMPMLLKWQAESFTETLLHTPELQRVSEAAERVSLTAKKLQEDFGAEREAAMDQFFAGVSEQRRGLLADLEQGQGRLEGTLKEFRETVAATDQLAGSVTTAAQAIESVADRFKSEPGESDPKRDKLAEFQSAVAEIGIVTEQMTALVIRLDQITEPTALAQRTAALRTAVAEAEQSAEQVIDHAFQRLVILIVLLPLVVAFSLALYRWLTRRSRDVAIESARLA